ncbi:hypothetical protein PV08_04165 [Exophiala spinifera]|uniref:Dienelactone hydrolase domain-containing protein n=1 Tax=Exophiala spinifera TaxID=91928 RepID=A0A0D2C064_9EURO|nr:uncharacterized protein PV08_04165 [Exophiala spinifera]KIW16974.1 hypothetical protein PV08_04165 [Exophiala spinifera]
MSHNQSAACCNTPVVISKGYKEMGKYATVDGLKTYITGPSSASHGILVIFDIFGFFPQTIQGADILAHSSEKHYQVFMPDWFDGNPADISWYPPDTEDKGRKLGAFFNTEAAPAKTVDRVMKVMNKLQSNYPNMKSWGVVGYCWGGKIVNLVSQQGTPFKAAASCHPAMVDPNDAPNVTIPILSIPSMDEDKSAMAQYEAALKVPNRTEWYDDQIHGFMAARSDLENKKVKAAYEKAYQTLLTWFSEHL